MVSSLPQGHCQSWAALKPSPMVVDHMDKCSASYSSLVMTKGIVLNFPLYQGPCLQFSYLIGVFQ